MFSKVQDDKCVVNFPGTQSFENESEFEYFIENIENKTRFSEDYYLYFENEIYEANYLINKSGKGIK